MTETAERVELCFPLLFNTSCMKPVPPHGGVMLFYLLSFISLLTVALNLLVIISISHFRQLHTTTNLIFLSLAVSDFLVGLVVIPGEIISMDSCWFLGDLVCVMYYFVVYTIISASLASIVLISVDRYVAICYPLHYPIKFTLTKVRITVVLCWICSLFFSSFFSYDHLKKLSGHNGCYGKCVINIAGDVSLVVSFIIPIGFIIILYMRVFLVAVSQARTMRPHKTAVALQHSSIKTSNKSELKAARTLGIVVAVYLMCYCPYFCVSLKGHKISVGSSVEAFMGFLVYFNSCLNPMIYAFVYPWFRKATRLIFKLQIMQPGSCDIKVM